MRRVGGTLTLLACVALLSGACDALTPEAPDLRVAPDVERPEPDVQLPPVPSLQMVDVPPLYEDGAFSIAGLFLEQETHMDREVVVRGVVREVYACEVEPPADHEEGEVVPGCHQPHIRVGDSPNATRDVLVTGYDAQHWEPQFQPGMELTIMGRYQQQARGFISPEDGLIVTDSFLGEGLTAPEPEDGEAPSAP